MEWPNELAPSDSFHGQLQRGRGIAFLRALEMPREQLDPLLLDCITRDPRYDQQTEARDSYAELVSRTELDTAPILAHVRQWDAVDEPRSRLALEVVRTLAKFDDSAMLAFLREYMSWGTSWSEVLDELFTIRGVADCEGLDVVFCQRFEGLELESAMDSVAAHPKLIASWTAANPLIASAWAAQARRSETHDAKRAARSTRLLSLPFEDALFLLGDRDLEGSHELAKHARPEHVELLRASIHPHRPWRCRVAVRALDFIGGDAACAALLEGAQRFGEMRPFARIPLETALCRLPSARVLPLARAWIQRSPWWFRRSGWSILTRHAEEQDVVATLACLREARDGDGHDCVSDSLEVLQRFPGRGWLPGVEESFVELQCARCRSEAVKTLALLDRDRFVATYARECLWDCQTETIELGIEHAPLTAPLVRGRLEELSRMPAWFDAGVITKARARLASGR